MADDDGPPPLDDVPELEHGVARMMGTPAGRSDAAAPLSIASSAIASASIPARPLEEVVAVDVSEMTLQEQLQAEAAAAAAKKRAEAEEAERREAARAFTAAPTGASTGTGSGKPASGGFKRGFLLGGSAPAPAPASAPKTGKGKHDTTESVTVVSAKPGAASRAPVLPEVQQQMHAVTAMRRTLDDNGWMTPELLSKVAANPRLLAGMSNPRCMAALAEFQKDGAAAAKKYERDAEITSFMKEFMGIMAEHFEQLAASEPAPKSHTSKPEPAKPAAAELTATSTRRIAPSTSSAPASTSTATSSAAVRSSSGSAAATASSAAAKPGLPANLAEHMDSVVRAAQEKRIATDDEDVREVLANRALMGILQDPRMQFVLEECRKDGYKLRYFMGIPEVREQLLMLQKAGLIRLTA